MGEEGKSHEGFFRKTFGPAAPMVMSVAWTLIIVLMVGVFSMAASMFDIPGMLDMLGFFRDGIIYLFLLILFISYASYFMGKQRRFFIALLPAAASAGLLGALWIASGTLNLLQYDLAKTVSAYALQYMFIAPVAVLAAGYAIVASLFFLRRPLFSGRAGGAAANAPASAAPPAAPAARAEPGDDDERKLRELKGMMKQAEKKYLGRQIDRETFDRIARDYHERITEIEGRKSAAA